MFRRLLWSILVFTLILVLSALSIDRTNYAEFAAQRVIRELQKSGIVLSLTNPNLYGLGLRAERAQIMVPQNLFSVEIEDPKASFNLRSLVMLQSVFNGTGLLYKAPLTVRAERRIYGDALDFSVQLEQLNLQNTPLNIGFGVDSGVIAADIKSGKITGDRLVEGKLNLKVQGVTKSRVGLFEKVALASPVIKRLIQNSSITMNLESLPNFSNVNGGCVAELKGERIDIGDVYLDLPLGSFKGRGHLVLDQKRTKIQDFSADLLVVISKNTMTQYGALIAGFSKGRIRADQRRFRLRQVGLPITLDSVEVLPP